MGGCHPPNPYNIEPMRRLFIPLIILLISLVVTGCRGGKTDKTSDVDNTAVDTIVDMTVYGRCGINTAMHTLEVITDDEDTLLCSINVDDTLNAPDVVRGGLFVGDRVAVLIDKNGDGTNRATKVINLTSLIGRWTSLERSFEIQEGGIVVSDMAEPQPYTEWRIFNGLLLLSSDTFDIYTLGADSLWLENKHGIYEYRRCMDGTI